MKLAPRFVLWFGALVIASTGALGYVLRQERRDSERKRFDEDVRDACQRAVVEMQTQATTDRGLLTGACASGELVDRTLIAVEAGEDRRVSLGQLVPDTRKSFGVDELVLVSGSGDVLGADPRSLLTLAPKDVTKQLAIDPVHFAEPGNKRLGVRARAEHRLALSS